jgi:hypothetical protein
MDQFLAPPRPPHPAGRGLTRRHDAEARRAPSGAPADGPVEEAACRVVADHVEVEVRRLADRVAAGAHRLADGAPAPDHVAVTLRRDVTALLLATRPGTPARHRTSGR